MGRKEFTELLVLITTIIVVYICALTIYLKEEIAELKAFPFSTTEVHHHHISSAEAIQVTIEGNVIEEK